MAGSTKQYIGIVDMLCEGPIQGLVNGKASVYVNDIPFERSSVVGTMNETQNGTLGAPLLSFDPANSNTTTVTTTNTTLTQNDVGKFVHIVVEAYQNITLQVLSFSNALVGTYNHSYITGTGVDSDFETVGDPSSYLRLVRPGGGEFVTQGIWDSANSRLNLYGGLTLFANQWTTRSDWTVQRVKAFKIVSVAADGASFVVDSSLGTSALNDVKFFIEELRTVDTSTNVNINDTVSKFDGSTVQFRRGTIDQAPIEQTNSLSGGTTITGTGNGVALKQSTDSSSPITTNYGFTSYSTDGYPEGQSFEESATAALEIPGFSSSSTGPRFGLTASQVKQVDEINIRINYPALLTHNNENGDKESASAIYVFQIATIGVDESTYGSWQTLFSKNGGRVTHTDKSTAPVSFDHTIGLDRFKPFDNFKIRIIRLTRDVGLPVRVDGGTGGETDTDKFTLQAASQISGADLSATIKDKLTYPFTAHAAISFSSKTYNSLPARSYLLQGLKVRIPTAYTPREYTSNGVAQYDSWWNGDFKKDPDGNYLLYYTDNPAWVFYDIVTNNRYGAGEWIDRNFINEYSLYRISKYCDELVDDGKGGTEPRFRANLYLSKSTDVYKVLKDMATIFTGMLYWLDGKITPVQDVPSEPIYTFTKGNVIDGVFNYESTGRKTRANQVVVTWNDPTANYEPVPLIVEDRENIVKTKKIISQNAVAMGATSEGQAYRYGRWKLWTAQNQKEIVTFETGLQGAYIRPGDVINVQDRDRYGVDFSGLTSSTTAATTLDVTLDRKLTNASNAALYKLTTLVTNYAAFYTGLNTVTIDSVTYNRGDRITGNVYLYDDDTNSLQLGTISTERDASNAFLNDSGTPLPTEWKEYTHVITKAVTLDNSGDISVATVDTDTTNSNVRDSEKTAYTTSGNNPTAPGLGTVWALQALDTDGVNILGSKKEYKVLSLAQNDSKNTYTISAVEHYNVKYDAVDKDYDLGVIPSNVFPIIEDPDEEVPAPQNIYIAIDSDSSKPGEELTINWLTPQETFTDTDDNTQTRDYSFIDKYELYHNVPHIESPIITDRLSYRFDNLEDGLYTFRVRTVSRKQNYSDFISTQYDVNDQYGTNVERVVGGLPKGIYANSQIEYSYNADDTYPEAVRFVEDTANGFSKAHALTDTSSASPLSDVSVAGLGSSELRREQEWYFLLLDGGASKVYWDTDSLANLPFYRKVSGGQWRGSAPGSNTSTGIGWTGIGSASVGADSTKLTGSGFNTKLKPRDIIAFEYPGNIAAVAIDSVDTSGSTYELSIDSEGPTLSGYLISTGDKIKVENATFTGTGTDLNGKEYYVTLSDNRTVALYTDEARTEAVSIGKTWSEGGFFRRVSVPAAKVVAVVSDTQAILDRSFSTSYSGSAYRHIYRPDYKDDAVFGRVRWHSYDEQTDLNSYRVESFITLEPNLRAGKAVVVTPSVETIRYESEADGTTTQSTSFTSLTATVSAVGFSNPEFRLVSFTFPGDVDVDSTVLDQTIVDNFVGPDDTGGFTKEFTINSDSSVAYSSTINNVDYVGTPILIKAEVREKNNVGINSFGTGDIIRIKDGAAGTQGRTVELNAEDYTIVYDDDGANPSFEGADSNITLTATARNFEANPLFRITVDGTSPSSSFSDWYDGTSGTDNTIYSTYITPPSSKPSYTSKVIEVQVAERPEGWDSDTQQGEDSDGNAIYPVVGASDSISILYLQTGEGGYAVANSNSAHSYTTDADGEFTTSTIPNSGTTLEVLIGGKRATYVGGTGVSSGGFSGVLGEGEWYVVSAVSSTSEFSAGNITESNDILTIAPVAVDNTIGYGENSETITWTIRVGTRSGSAVDLTTTQSLTKSIEGSSVTITSTSTTNGVTTVNFSDGTSITITDGDDGTSEGVLVVYADDANGTNKSTTRGSNQNYVLYYEWTGSAPSVSDVTGTWVLFVGDDGETQGVIPVYSTVATPTSTSQLSLTYSSQEYITFFEYTGTKPTSVTNAMVSQTYVPFVGEDGTSVTITSTSTSNGVTTVTFSDNTTITISDGDEGTSEGVLVVYADDANGTNKSATRGSGQNYVLYYEWSGTKPSVSDVTGTWVLFVGEDGETQGVIPVYSSVANPTSTSQLSLSPGTKEYITFFEYTGTKPTSVTNAMVSQTYVPFVGEDGTSVTITSTSTSGGVTTVNFSDGSSITINDGDDGQTQGVKVFYADDASGTNQSTTQGDRTFVKYVEYTGTAPTSGGTSGFVQFIGDDGQTKGVIPVYSSVANPTSTSQLSLSPGTKEYVTFFEYTGNTPTSVLSSMVSATYVKFVGDDGQSITGNPGPRSVFAYIYYQSSSTSAPTVPALSTFTPNFTNGSVSSSNSNWSTNTPTFAAGNTNKYWYFTFTATESGTYNNGYPSATKNSSPSAGSSAIQGIGFSGLVTFSSTNNIDGFNPIKWINDNGASTGTSNTTTINGGLIRTDTIAANKLVFTPLTTDSGVAGTTQAGSLATASAVNLATQVSGTLGKSAGGTGDTTGPFGYASAASMITGEGLVLTNAIGDLAALDSINVAAAQSYITGLGDLATQDEDDLDFIGLSATTVQAGKIVLATSGIYFAASSASISSSNAIVLDTTSGNNTITIYSGSTPRVKLGKL